jgi:hypothetical protein
VTVVVARDSFDTSVRSSSEALLFKVLIHKWDETVRSDMLNDQIMLATFGFFGVFVARYPEFSGAKVLSWPDLQGAMWVL